MNRIKEEQDRKFKEMIEAEKAKADLEAVAKLEAQEKALQEVIKKTEEEQKKKSFLAALTNEPAEGDLINVAFRLPNGSRLTRNFRQAEPIKVESAYKLMFSFLHSKDDPVLQGNFELFHDYPPKKIQDAELEATFDQFFGHSDRQLITIHEEGHH